LSKGKTGVVQIQSKNAVDEQIDVVKLQTHELPWFIIWSVTLSVPLAVALTNVMMVHIDAKLLAIKFGTVQDIMEREGSFALGALALAGICAAYGLVATCLVLFISPACAGSGIPEVKGYLNGNSVKGLFGLQAFIVRVFGIVLATASGLPIGREGPMVGIGSNIGYAIVVNLALPYYRKKLRFSSESTQEQVGTIVDEERFSYAKRIGSVMGAAAGIATAFNAPIGGILYMFEEVTVTNWEPELTFRTFVCTVVGVMVTKGLFNLAGDDVHKLLIYAENDVSAAQWDWKDVPLIVGLAASVGLLAALMTRIFEKVWKFRRRMAQRLHKAQPWAKIAEVLLCVVVIALIHGCLPAVAGCNPDNNTGRHLSEDGTGRRLASTLSRTQYTCPDGEHNEMATVLLSGAEGAVKHLFARGLEHFEIGPIAVSFVAYFSLAICMPGLAIPMGSFVPSMMIGALCGRMVGEALSKTGAGFADPGVFSMAGSAAMLGGFTHMTIAIVALLAEAAHDLSLVPLLMLSIFVSHIVVKLCNHHGYDEILILAKGVPFLEVELPQLLAQSACTARDICEIEKRGLVQPLPVMCPVKLLIEALKHEFATHFPVEEDGVILGMVTRSRVESAIVGVTSKPDMSQQVHTSNVRDVPSVLLGLWASWFPKDEQAALGGGQIETGLDGLVPMMRIMNPTPYTLLDDMPVSRLHPLFSRSGLQAACVMSRTGTCIGVLNRIILIKVVEDAIHGHMPALGTPCEITHNRHKYVDGEHPAEQDMENYIRELEQKVETLTEENKRIKATFCDNLSDTAV